MGASYEEPHGPPQPCFPRGAPILNVYKASKRESAVCFHGKYVLLHKCHNLVKWYVSHILKLLLVMFVLEIGFNVKHSSRNICPAQMSVNCKIMDF